MPNTEIFGNFSFQSFDKNFLLLFVAIPKNQEYPKVLLMTVKWEFGNF